ncbi:MAG: hypothetical protein AB1726_06125 [Planctomycetota bacterium]
MAQTGMHGAGGIEGGGKLAGRPGTLRLRAAGLGMLLLASVPAAAQNEVRSWGACVVDSAWNHEAFVQLEGNNYVTYALRADGTVAAWGRNVYDQCEVPELPLGVSYVDVAPGWYHGLGCRSDGTVVAWGRNNYGQLDVPVLPPGVSYVQVEAGEHHSVALDSIRLRRIAGWGAEG